MKRKHSLGEVIQAFKKCKISRKGANKLKKIKTYGLPKPTYGVKRKMNFGISARDKQLLGLGGKVTTKTQKLGRRLSLNPNFIV